MCLAVASTSDPAYGRRTADGGQERAYLILFWVGSFALFKGFSQIMLAFGVMTVGPPRKLMIDRISSGAALDARDILLVL